jgi:peptidoglycan/LPS O-acetylase OafA/YrhL
MQLPVTSTSKRVDVLDGVRAVAIALVIAHHAGFAKGGGVGVTVFFVLSGFLITGLLIKPRALTREGLGRFWLRRLARLFPALLALCGFCVVWALATQTGHDRTYLLTQVLTSLTYTQDFYLGHGHATSDFGYLGHTWSLAIEQQFYLLWPLLLAVVLRLGRSRLHQAALTLAVALVFTAWRAHLASRGLNAHVGLNIDAQADSLLVGCALALLLSGEPLHLLRRRERLLDAGSVLFLAALLIFAETRANLATPGRVGYLLVSLGTAVLITRLLTPATTAFGRTLHRALSWRPVVWVGLISYSLYLWHPVVFAIAKRDVGITSRPAQLMTAPVLLVVILAVSWVSYRYIEQPFQRLKNRSAPMPSDDPAAAIEIPTAPMAPAVQPVG